MQILVAKDQKENKGYIVLHNGDAFLIDPKGDYYTLRKALGENQLKAIFLTHFEPETLSLLAAFVDIPIYIENSNGIQLQKMRNVLNLSMLKFIFVKQVLSFKLYADLQIGLIPTIGLNKKGTLIAIFNTSFFIGKLVIDAKFSKKAVKLGASSFYHKLVTIILNNQHNIIYPTNTPGFPAYKIIKDNPLAKQLLPRKMLQPMGPGTPQKNEKVDKKAEKMKAKAAAQSQQQPQQRPIPPQAQTPKAPQPQPQRPIPPQGQVPRPTQPSQQGQSPTPNPYAQPKPNLGVAQPRPGIQQGQPVRPNPYAQSQPGINSGVHGQPNRQSPYPSHFKPNNE